MDGSRATDQERRWAAAVAHRERLLRLARRRTLNAEDAEDIVHEAILRCVRLVDLDEDRIDRLLTTVTVRLCVDEQRRRNQVARLHWRLGGELPLVPGADEPVCDRAEAQWVAAVVETLPPRQREVLAAKADGLSCSEIGCRYRMSYKAVESALRHARTTVRAALAATGGLLGLVFARRWWRTRTSAVVAPTLGALMLGATQMPAITPSPRPVETRPMVTDSPQPPRRPPVRSRPPSPSTPPSLRLVSPPGLQPPTIPPLPSPSEPDGIPLPSDPPIPTDPPRVPGSTDDLETSQKDDGGIFVDLPNRGVYIGTVPTSV